MASSSNRVGRSTCCSGCVRWPASLELRWTRCAWRAGLLAASLMRPRASACAAAFPMIGGLLRRTGNIWISYSEPALRPASPRLHSWSKRVHGAKNDEQLFPS
eukprot:16407036-Heterocapsa_arctica.AAC.1